MGSIKGKLEVDLYANPDPMIQGFMKGEQAAKRASGSIGESIDKINNKQLKNIGAGLLGNLGVIGALDAGTKIADEMVKGFQDGSIKGFGGAIESLGATIVKNLENIPIAGALGRLIAAGVDAVSGGTMSQEGKQQGSRGEYDEKNKAAIEFARIKKIRDDADAEVIKKDADAKTAAAKKTADEEGRIRKFYDDQQKSSLKEVQKIKDDLRHSTMSERDIEIERIQALPQLVQRQKDEAIAAYDQLQAEKAKIIAQKESDNAKEKAAKEELDRIEKIKDAEIEAKQDARDEAIKAYEDYQEAQDVFAKTAEELDKKAAGVSATTSVDTAIGSVKIAGASDFSVQKEMDIAESTLKEAKNQSDYLKSIDSALHKLGGGT